ncbi:Potassium Voltage-Gated Channel Subfamily Kqt Member 3 [Manis pentadactyla]|nr:Potassium Voltage-Gated Channel Subfamily Kqt Member 3 [Manis pentadactyla]
MLMSEEEAEATLNSFIAKGCLDPASTVYRKIISKEEFENTPEDSPEPEARGVVPGRSETPGQLPAAAEDGEKRCGCLVDRGRRLGAAAKETRAEDFALPEGAPRTSSPLCAQDSDVQAHVEEKEEPLEELESLEDSDVDEDELPVEEMVYTEAYVEDMHVEEMVYLEA